MQTLTITNQPGDAPHAGLTFHVYVVDRGELLRYGKEAERRTVEFYDTRWLDPANRLGREGQFVADYFAETLLKDRERLAGGLDLCGYEPTWKVDGAAMAQVLSAISPAAKFHYEWSGEEWGEGSATWDGKGSVMVLDPENGVVDIPPTVFDHIAQDWLAHRKLTTG